MINISLAQIIEILNHYGYFVVFPLAVVEGPMITVLSGFLIYTGIFNAYVVFTVLLAGDIVGDLIYYALGRYGKEKIIHYVGRHIGATEKRIAILENHFHRHDWKILLFAKTQAIGSVILFVAGIVKMPYARFIIYNIVGTVPKTILLLVVGYYFGKAYATIDTYLSYFAIIWLLVSCVLLGSYFYFKKYIQKKEFKDV